MNRTLTYRGAGHLALMFVVVLVIASQALAQPISRPNVSVPTLRQTPSQLLTPPVPKAEHWFTTQGHTTKATKVYLGPSLTAESPTTSTKLTIPELKLDGNLLKLTKQIRLDGSFEQNATNHLLPTTQAVGLQQTIPVRIDDQERVYVYVAPSTGHTLAEVITELTDHGSIIQIASDRANRLEAWVPVSEIMNIAALAQIGPIRLISDPVTNTGSVTSVGVSRLRADVSSQVLGTTGSGVKIGVMSDDCGSGPGGPLSLSIASGDINPSFVSLSDFDSLVGEHEGLAMSEIVQDVAPGAQIYFATAEGGELTFADHMAKLSSAGCKVISDDIQYFDEPVFEDGYLAQVVDSLASKGVFYVSSAGNQAGSSYFGTYTNMAGTGILAGMNVCDFGGGNPYLPMSVIAGWSISWMMQWDDPFGGSSNDYNFYVINQARTAILGGSTSIQNAGYPYPFETLSGSLSPSGTYYLVVERKTISGTDPNPTARFKITGWPNTPIIAFGSNVSSTFGHSSADSCIAAAAIDVNTSDAGAVNYNTVEAFSGQGPSYRITFGPGTRTIDLTRQKPDVACFDGVHTSVSTFPTFYGTSASSPHIAGVAGLLMSLPGMDAVKCRAFIRSGTIDEGAPGNDYAFGYGRLDAFKALTQAISNRSLTTGGNYFASYKTVNAAIPDGSSSLSSTITPSLNSNVDSVYLSFTIDGHNKYGDLTVTLTSPDATTRTLLTRPASGAGTSLGRNPNVILGDQASTALESYDPGATEVIGFYVPQNTLSTAAGFHGRAIAGNWTLNIADGAATNSGTLKDWGLYFKVQPNAGEGLTLSAAPPYIWSSDASMKTVIPTVNVVNGASPQVSLVGVTANEVTSPGDMTGISAGSYTLRAVSNAAGTGRVYTATYNLLDMGGYNQNFTLAVPSMKELGHAAAIPAAGPLPTVGVPNPNPVTVAGGTTQFTYTLAAPGNVVLKIFDLFGMWVKNVDYGVKSAGVHTANWDRKRADGTPLPNGTYIFQLSAGGVFRSGTVTLVP